MGDTPKYLRPPSTTSSNAIAAMTFATLKSALAATSLFATTTFSSLLISVMKCLLVRGVRWKIAAGSGRLRQMRRQRCVGDRHSEASFAAVQLNLGLELLGERIDDGRSQSNPSLRRFAWNPAHAIVRNRQFPIGPADLVGDEDLRVGPVRREGIFDRVDDKLGDDQPE